MNDKFYFFYKHFPTLLQAYFKYSDEETILDFIEFLLKKDRYEIYDFAIKFKQYAKYIGFVVSVSDMSKVHKYVVIHNLIELGLDLKDILYMLLEEYDLDFLYETALSIKGDVYKDKFFKHLSKKYSKEKLIKLINEHVELKKYKIFY
jgi:hypothetical protein